MLFQSVNLFLILSNRLSQSNQPNFDYA